VCHMTPSPLLFGWGPPPWHTDLLLASRSALVISDVFPLTALPECCSDRLEAGVIRRYPTFPAWRARFFSQCCPGSFRCRFMFLVRTGGSQCKKVPFFSGLFLGKVVSFTCPAPLVPRPHFERQRGHTPLRVSPSFLISSSMSSFEPLIPGPFDSFSSWSPLLSELSFFFTAPIFFFFLGARPVKSVRRLHSCARKENLPLLVIPSVLDALLLINCPQFETRIFPAPYRFQPPLFPLLTFDPLLRSRLVFQGE